MVGAEPPAYGGRTWTYRGNLFVEQSVTSDGVAAMLRGGAVQVGDVSARPSPLHVTANRRKLPSNADYRGHRLPWPVTRYEVTTRTRPARRLGSNR
jgi:hypothetical protein